jgi:alkyldihydroxyacetonephosphate synthase
MQAKTIRATQCEKPDLKAKAWFQPLVDIVGEKHVLTGFPDKLAYGRDRWPFGNMRYRFGHLPGSLPLAVIMPGSTEEVCSVLRLMHQERQPVIPYGAGSGVLGGAAPLDEGVVTIDMKRLNKVQDLDEVSKLVTVQGGMNGERLESYLNARRLTTGHFPQSLHMSTVAGWVACRGAGQASSRYGKIEDIVAGLKIVLADGQLVTIKPAPRRATGPGLMELFIGSEGTLGMIVEVTLRVWEYPEKEIVHGVGFSDYVSGLEALRLISQAGYRPAITRLYDAPESKNRIEKYSDYNQLPCLAMLSFVGNPEMAALEERKCIAIAESVGGRVCSSEPVHDWLRHRFESLSAKPASEGKLMDTIEMSAKWSAMSAVYEKTREAVLAVNPEAHVGAHWSHVYPDGACVYMTFIIPGGDEEKAAREHGLIWDNVMQACMREGGSISHHHGVGYMRGKYMGEELGAAGLSALQAIKNALDPNHIMNPGKLGLR